MRPPSRRSLRRLAAALPLRRLAAVLLLRRLAAALLLALAGGGPGGGLACGGGAGAPPFLLLLTSDTTRADRLGAYGSDLGATPNLDALLAESVVFERAYAPCSYTLPSVAGMLTGRHPEALGMHANVSLLGGEASTLAEVLGAHGFATGAAVSNWVLRRGTGIERGFAIYDDRYPGRETNRAMPEREAADTTDAALAVLDELRASGRPVFLWVHYQDPHGPYVPPAGLRARFLAPERERPDGGRELGVAGGGRGGIPRYQLVEGPREVAFYRAGYAGEIAYLDAEIGRLLAGLAERGLRERAAIVYAADHGESLGEQDYWFAHGELLTEPLVRIPLALRIPGVAPGRREEPASLLDVFPTVLAWAGIERPEAGVPRDLLGDAPPRPIYLAALRGSPVPRRGVIAGGLKYLVSLGPDGPEESLHRLGDDARDLAAGAPEQLAVMRETLATLRAALPRPPERRQVIGAEERERLRQLGYLEDAEEPPAPGEAGEAGSARNARTVPAQ